MKRYRGTLALILAFVAFMGVMLVFFQNETTRPQKPTATLSLVVYGDNEERWRALEQGIRQACSELGIEKPKLNRARTGDAAHQIDLLYQEAEAGTSGLLVAADQTEALQETLTAVDAGTPIVLLGRGGESPLPCVAADDAAMGRLLADELAPKKQLVVLKHALWREEAALRYEAFMAQMAGLSNEIDVWDTAENTLNLSQYLTSRLTAEEPAGLVVLDNTTMETALEALRIAMVDTPLYGIGSSDRVVNALDTGSVGVICYANEYAIGYQGARLLCARLGLCEEEPLQPIQYGIATRQTLYTPEVERILFPLNQ